MSSYIHGVNNPNRVSYEKTKEELRASVVWAVVTIIVFIAAAAMQNKNALWGAAVTLFFSYVYCFRFAMELHNWWYRAQNIGWIKTAEKFNNTILFLSLLIWLTMPISYPIILLVAKAKAESP